MGNSKKQNSKKELSTNDSDSTCSSHNLSQNITAKKKGAIYSKIVEDQQNSYSKINHVMDVHLNSDVAQEQYNYYPNDYQTNYYQDQQQIDYYNQDYYRYYGYQQADSNYCYNYEQYPNQYCNTQDFSYNSNPQNVYYNDQYYQQNGQVVANSYPSYEYCNVNYNYNFDQNMANLQESNITQC